MRAWTNRNIFQFRTLDASSWNWGALMSPEIARGSSVLIRYYTAVITSVVTECEAEPIHYDWL